MLPKPSLHPKFASGLRRLASLSGPFLVASAIAFVTCLALPAYTTGYYDGKVQQHYGIEAFLLGPIGLFAGHFSWLANAPLWVSWVVRTGSSGLALALAIASLFIALTFLLGTSIAVGSAGDFPYRATHGYYVWLSSILLSAASSLVYLSPSERDIARGAS